MGKHSVERLVAPLAAGLVVLLALLGLIGTAIRDPRPHDIPVGLVGPAQAVQPMTDALAQKAPGVFKFTTYDTEGAARAALDRRDVDGVVIVGPTGSHIVVAGAAGGARPGAAAWIANSYDAAALVPMGALVALTAFAAGAFVAGFTRLLGPAGLGLSALVIILLDLISSGGPAGGTILPDVYRWMSPWMPAG